MRLTDFKAEKAIKVPLATSKVHAEHCTTFVQNWHLSANGAITVTALILWTAIVTIRKLQVT